MKMEPIVSSETSAIKSQTPGNYPKRNKLHLQHGESLRTKKIKNIRELYRDLIDFKYGYQPSTNIINTRRVIWLRTPRVFWLGRGTIFSPN